MSSLFDVLSCCCGRSGRRRASRVSEKCVAATTGTGDHAPYQDQPTETELASQIVAKLLAADRNDVILTPDLQSTIHTYGWYESLAAAVLAALENAIALRKEMGPAMKSAYEKVVVRMKLVKEWADHHPEMAAVLITLMALGILAIMTPWLMAWLGFAEEGIIEASWAARWQATYEGLVPKRSLFSYLQSLGTKIGRNWRG